MYGVVVVVWYRARKGRWVGRAPVALSLPGAAGFGTLARGRGAREADHASAVAISCQTITASQGEAMVSIVANEEIAPAPTVCRH